MVCRVCLNKAEFEIDIFEDSSDQQIQKIIQKHFWFTPDRYDAISTVICLDCWKIIREFDEFYETIHTTHKLFFSQQVLAGECTAPKTESSEQTNDYEEIEAIVTVYEGEELPDTFSHKQESDKLKLNEDASVEGDSNEDGQEDIDDKDYKPIKKPRKKALKKTLKKVSSVKKKNPQSKPEVRWSNAESAEIIRKHLNLNCDICSFPTQTFGELEKHFRQIHTGIKAYIQCCGRRYNKIQRVAQHAYMHEDPNSFQCDVCQKNFSSAYSMRSHKVAYHPTEDQLTFKCDQCDKRFSLQHLLDYHKASHVPVEERTHLCTQCQKLFASEHLLKAHISMRHKHPAHVCHICAKTIRDKAHFKKHMKEHTEEIAPRVKCPHPGCDKYLKDEENLKVHLRRHRPENQNFACDQCGKVLKNRMALTSHRLYTHADKLFSCHLCSKTFKRKITLNEHMAFHTGEPLYKCPFCERTFNSNANMHSHKKKQHPVEWENWRKTKTQSSQIKITDI